MSRIYVTVTYISSDEVTCVLGPFETLQMARSRDPVGRSGLIYERQSTDAFIAEKYPTL